MATDEYDLLLSEFDDAAPPRRGKPLDYRKLYQEVGGKYGVDPDLLYNQARQESVNFAPKYVYGPGKSPAGAAGLAQFMPDTARQYGLHVGKGRDDRYNPRLAADAQARMMRDLIAKHGDSRLALAAYNSGHNKTSTQAAAAARRIPETRTYVQKVAPQGDPYDQLLDEVESKSAPATDPYDQLLSEFDGGQAAAPPPFADVTGGARGVNTRGVEPGTPAARRAFRQRAEHPELPTTPTGMGDVRMAEEQARQATQPSIGELRRQDEPEVQRVLATQRAVDAEIARESTPSGAFTSAFTRALRGDVTPPLPAHVRVTKRLVEDAEADSRRKELLASLTAEDRQNITDAITRMRGQGSVSRGIETGSQRFGSGLLYKIAGISDIIGGRESNVLGNYLRRQAGRGELSIEQIEAEMPPDARQYWADFLTTGLGQLPEIYGATQLFGPSGGFAVLGASEAAGRKRSPVEIGVEGLKGYALGKVFEGAAAFESAPAAGKSLVQRAVDTARSGAAIGAGTIAVEKAFGATNEQALQSALANVAFHTAGRAPELVGRFAQAAERTLKRPDTEVRTSLTEEAANEARVKEAAVAAAEAKTQPVPSRTAPEGQVAPRTAEPLPQETYASPELQAAVTPTTAPSPLSPRSSLAELLAARAAEGPAEIVAGITARPPAKTPTVQPAEVRSEEAAPKVTTSPPLERRVADLGPPTERVVPVGSALAMERPTAERRIGDRREYPREEGAQLLGEQERREWTSRLYNMHPEDMAQAQLMMAGKQAEAARPTFGDRMREAEAAPAPAIAPEPQKVAAPEKSEVSERAPITVRREGTRFVVEQTTPTGKVTYSAKSAESAQAIVDQLSKGETPPAAKQIIKARELREKEADVTEAEARLSRAERRVSEGKYEYTERQAEEDGNSAASLTDELAAQQKELAAMRKRKGEAGYVDIGEIREGFQAGALKLAEAKEKLQRRFPFASDEKLQVILNRREDPLIGIVAEGQAQALPNPNRALLHEDAFDIATLSPDVRWRYEPTTRTVYWDGKPSAPERATVVEELNSRGLEVRDHKGLFEYVPRKLWQDEIDALARPQVEPQPVHHSRAQPRTPEGQFAGPPSDAELIRQVGREYHRDYNALAEHAARRQGLDVVNDDVAANYFTRLRRFVSYNPEKVALVEQAENAYARGKYADATRLAEQTMAGTHEFPNQLGIAKLAAELTEKGLEIPTHAYTTWKDVMKEVRKRLGETGGIAGPGSTFYDVNKYPKGGKPDHEKIAYILEPVVDMLRADAKRLIAAGKLKAADYTAHVRKAVADMLATSDFNDWHPLNKSAAMGVLVDKLRSEGPPPTEARTTTGEPAQKPRSLPITKEKSGREPGLNRLYTPIPEEKSTGDAVRRIQRDGLTAAEEWYHATAAEPSAERTEVGRLLNDELQARAADMAETNPRAAEQLILRARELSDIGNVRATAVGQEIQAHARLLKYTPADVMKEIQTLAAKGASVPAKEVMRLSKLAVDQQRSDFATQKADQRVATLEARAEAREAGGGGKGRTRRPGAIDPEIAKARLEAKEARKRRDAARREISRRLKAIEGQRSLLGYYRRGMNITRGLMVSATSTAMRNLQTQLARFNVERLTDVTEHTMRKLVGLDSDFTYRRIWSDTARQLHGMTTPEWLPERYPTVRAETKARELLAGHPEQLARMFNTHQEVGQVQEAFDWRTIDNPIKRQVERVFQKAERAVEIANFINRTQEFHLRSAEYLAELDLHLLKDKGMSLEQFVKRNGMDAIPLKLHEAAAHKALEVTFADMPNTSRPAGRLLAGAIEVANYFPPTMPLPTSFARFTYNNLKFLYRYNPLGGLIDTGLITFRNRAALKKIARVEADTTLSPASKDAAIAKLRGDMGNIPRAVSRAMIGAGMLYLAMQFRDSDHAGEKWYEVKVGGHTFDTRPFGPFSTYLFLAEGIRRWQRGEKPYTWKEIAEAVGASTGPGGTAISLADKLYDYITNGNWSDVMRTLKAEGGDFGRAILTPIRQFKDFIAAVDETEGVTRETSTEPFLGPIKESLPYASRNLPEAHVPTTAAPMRQTHPGTKQALGWRVITPKTYLQSELDSLNFTPQEVLPRTGIPQLDDLQERLMGPLADQLSDELQADEQYKKMSRAERGVFLRDMLEELRDEVRSQAEYERPDLVEQMKEKRKPRRDKELDRELEKRNSPGMSRALQLGVPLPIPKRRAGEDDIAYRARLIQTGRAQRSALDEVIADSSFASLSTTAQRKKLHAAVI